MIANYRKTHLWGDYEKSFYTPGPGLLDPVEFMGIKLSMLICFDIEFTEPARILALKSAQLLIVPTALTSKDNTTLTVPSRALENHVFIVYANRCGSDRYPDGHETTFCGNSVIVDPDGHDLARASASDPELLVVPIDTDEQRWKDSVARNPYLSARRTDLY